MVMRRTLPVLMLIAALALPAPVWAAASYLIGNIPVDTTGTSPADARANGWREAQRRAWPMLWARLTGEDESAAPKLNDGALDGIVAAIEVDGTEQVSATRYLATLGVVFDRARAERYLGSAGLQHSPPMLLIPVLVDAGTRTAFEQPTAWTAAWARRHDEVTALDYVLPAGSAADAVLLTGWQPQRPDRPTWRNLLNRYGAVDILSPELVLTRTYAGGPLSAVVIARHGPDNVEVGRAELRNDGGALDNLMTAAAAQADALYAAALRDGRLRYDNSLAQEPPPLVSAAPEIGVGEADVAEAATKLDVVVDTPDGAAWTAIEASLRRAPGVTPLVTSLSLGGATTVQLNYAGSRDALRAALDTAGLRLDEIAGRTLLRGRRADEVPLRPAAPAADATVIDEPDAPAAPAPPR